MSTIASCAKSPFTGVHVWEVTSPHVARCHFCNQLADEEQTRRTLETAELNKRANEARRIQRDSDVAARGARARKS